MQTKAELAGDHYVVNGSKLYITNGAVADVCLLYAKTQKGLQIFDQIANSSNEDESDHESFDRMMKDLENMMQRTEYFPSLGCSVTTC